MFAWIALALIAAVLVAAVLSRVRAYNRLFSDGHFLEVAHGVRGLKSAAFADPSREPAMGIADPRILLTSVGLAVVYTVQEQEHMFTHHLSVSYPSGVTANALGATFVAYVAQLVGLPIGKLRCEVGEHTVHHGEAVFDAAEHEALGAIPVLEVLPANVAALRREAMDARTVMNWQRRA